MEKMQEINFQNLSFVEKSREICQKYGNRFKTKDAILTIKQIEKQESQWENTISERGKAMGYPNEEIEKDIKEIKKLEKGWNNRYFLNKFLEHFLITKMKYWDLQYEIDPDNEEGDSICLATKFEDYKNKIDAYIYNKKKDIILAIDFTTAELYEEIKKKMHSIKQGIDSEPKNYIYHDYHKNNKSINKKQGCIKYPDSELSKKPIENIPRVVINITRQTLLDYFRKEKELENKKGEYNGIITPSSLRNENQIKWAIFEQIKLQLEDQILYILGNINLLLQENKIDFADDNITFEKQTGEEFKATMKSFYEKVEKYKTNKKPYSYEKFCELKEKTKKFCYEMIEKMQKKKGNKKILNRLEILNDKINKSEIIFKTYKEYYSINKRVQELKRKTKEEDFEIGLDTRDRKIDDIDYQKNNNLLKNQGFGGNPIYNYPFIESMEEKIKAVAK